LNKIRLLYLNIAETRAAQTVGKGVPILKPFLYSNSAYTGASNYWTYLWWKTF